MLLVSAHSSLEILYIWHVKVHFLHVLANFNMTNNMSKSQLAGDCLNGIFVKFTLTTVQCSVCRTIWHKHIEYCEIYLNNLSLAQIKWSLGWFYIELLEYMSIWSS